MGLLRKTGGRYAGVPNLVIAQRVIDKMQAAAQTHMEDETGEAMVGIFTQGLGSAGTLYVLDTISPDDSAVRQFHTFQQGDERQDEIIWWLQENWHAARAKRGLLAKAFDKWDVPLRYIGDWHKQPGYMIAPSGGDLMTALGWIDDPDNAMDFLLAPIVTLGHEAVVEASGPGSNFLMMPRDDAAMRVDFWFIDSQVRMFAAIAPTVYPDDQLPALAPYPWHLIDEHRFEAESQRLKDDQLLVSITLWDTGSAPPLDVCFLVGRAGASKLLIISTTHDYPHHAPRARIAPFVAMGADDDMYTVFAAAWRASQPLNVPFTWTPESWLLDFIHAAEKAAGIAHTPTATARATGTMAAVTQAETMTTPAPVKNVAPPVSVTTESALLAEETMQPVTDAPSAEAPAEEGNSL